MTRLNGKVMVVTGATSGIGRACALRFAEEGATALTSRLRREPSPLPSVGG